MIGNYNSQKPLANINLMVKANFKGENAHLLLTSDMITYSSILRQNHSTSHCTFQEHLLPVAILPS